MNQTHSVPESSPELNQLMDSISSFIQAAVNSALVNLTNSPDKKLIVDMPLLNTYSVFKGTKPMAIVGISKEPIPTTNWRRVAKYTSARMNRETDSIISHCATKNS